MTGATGATGASGLWKSFENQGFVSKSGADQFEIIDNVFSRTLDTMSKSFDHATVSGVCQKRFRIVCDEGAFIPKTIEISIHGDQFQIVGKLVVKSESGLCATKRFRKVYQLPHYVVPGKYSKLFTEHGHLVVEFPIIGAESVFSGVADRSEYFNCDSRMEPEVESVTVGMVIKATEMPCGIPNSISYTRMGASQTDDYLTPKYWDTPKRSGAYETKYSWDDSVKMVPSAYFPSSIHQFKNFRF